MAKGKEGNKIGKGPMILLGVVGLLFVVYMVYSQSTPSPDKKELLGKGEELQSSMPPSKEESNDENVMDGEEVLNTLREQQLSTPSYQYVIDDSEFKETMLGSKDSIIYVQYYSPVCNYCISETPVIAEGYENSNKEHKFYQYDVTLSENEEIYGLAGLTGVPTVVKYVNGKEESRIVGAIGDSKIYTDYYNGEPLLNELLERSNAVNIEERVRLSLGN